MKVLSMTLKHYMQQVDYLGVASCLHSFLFSNEIELIQRHFISSDADLKYFPQLKLSKVKDFITIPKNTMKR